MAKPLRDSIRYLKDEPSCSYADMTRAAREAEMENTDLKGVSVRAKGAVEVGDDKKIDDESPQMKALRQQVQKLMSLQYKNGGGKGAGKNAKSAQQAPTSKGPAINASGPFTDGKPQYNVITVGGGVMLNGSVLPL